MKGSYRQEGHRYGNPEVPDDDMESGLKGEEPFPASTGIAIVIGAKGESNGKSKSDQKATGERV